MFRSLDRLNRTVRPALLAGGVAALITLTNPAARAAAQPDPDMIAPVVEIVYVVESIDGSESVSRGDTEVTVTLTSDVLFEFDRAEVTPEARDRLEQVADQIRQDGAGGVITVEGHTDNQGSASYNQDLSERRAESVRDELADLLAGEGVSFETEGHGESQPRVPNDSEENQARNRRVEITYHIQE